MIFLYLIILFISIYGIRFNYNSFNENYLSKDSTLSIKGIFVLLVFCRHFNSYVESTNLLDDLFYHIDSILGQLIVVMFLFYSGFGIAKQIQTKNKDGRYIRTFLKHRLFPVWFRFVICVGFFLILSIINGDISQYSLSYLALSFTGYFSIGNSNWFMFVTFALYGIVYMSYRFFKLKNSKTNLVIVTALSILLMIFLYWRKGDDRSWWNTLLCFPLGMWFAHFQNRIEKHMRKPKDYSVSVIVLFIVFSTLMFVNRRLDSVGLSFIILSLVFVLVVVAITMKVKISNKTLDFFGKHVFSIYILQRIPMIALKGVFANKYLYFVVCFIITVTIAVSFDYLCDKAKSLVSRNHNRLRDA